MGRTQIPLDSEPEVAAAIGRLVGHWGVLEDQFADLLGLLLRIDGWRSRMVFNTFPSLAQKLNLIERLLHAFAEENEARELAIGFCERGKAYADIRNKYVHATWGGGEGEFAAIPKPLPSNPIHQSAFLRANEPQGIQSAVDKVSELSGEISDFLMSQRLRDGHKLPPHIERIPLLAIRERPIS